jgi:hypothetical protein
VSDADQALARIELLLQSQLAETTALKAILQALLTEAVCLTEGGEEVMQTIETHVKTMLTPKANATADQMRFHSMASQAAKAFLDPLVAMAEEAQS